MQKNLDTIFLHIAESSREYLSQWYLDTPVIVTSEKYMELKHVQKLLYKVICYYIEHAIDYNHIFPVSDTMRSILNICRPYPYRIGTYRPDFLIDNNKQLRICEIGARFPLNGYFLSGISEYIGQYKYEYKSYLNQAEYNSFLQHLFDYWRKTGKIYVLKGNDKPCDIKYYIPFFERMNIDIKTIYPEQISSSFRELKSHAVINEFNQMEMECMSEEILTAIAASNALNDMRTIFLIHDKRFLAVLSDDEFLSGLLTKEDILFLKPYLIPTYTYIQKPEVWNEAKNNKDHWIIKHALLGKSEQVYAGKFCTNQEWRSLFNSSVIETMVLQPFIDQLPISSTIKDNRYNDFAVGTLLCFDDCFFGPGIFRTSSFEITNRKDDRKMSPCFTDNYSGFDNYFIL